MSFVSQSVRVVLADSSDLVRERLALLLSVLVGVEVVGQACAYDTALEMTRVLRPDVLVMDGSLCRMTCAELIQIAKTQNQAAVVIMLTGDNARSTRAKYLEMGADFCFHKPFEYEKTLTVCQELAELRARSAGRGSL